MIHTERNTVDHASPRFRRSWHRPLLGLQCIVGTLMLTLAGPAPAKAWRGLTVAPEHRCAPYDNKRDKPSPQYERSRLRVT